MSTKPPLPPVSSEGSSLERIAYALVEDIPTTEPNDRLRLAYCLWAWLGERRGTLREAVQAAGTRSTSSIDQICGIISQRLKERGIQHS